MKIKALPAKYIADETFIVDSEQRYDFGADTKEEYVIITKKDYEDLIKSINEIPIKKAVKRLTK
jgi:hypothetical protein